jgi:MMPL family
VPDDVLGIPLHPLVVHAVVVLMPLAAVGTIAIALVPRWRDVYGWLVLAASTIVLATVPIATQSGKRLRDSLNLGGPVAEKVRDHQQFGDRMIYAAAGLWLVLVVMLWLHRTGRRGGVMMLVAGLSIVAALAGLVLVTLTGHSGSNAVWNPAG